MRTEEPSESANSLPESMVKADANRPCPARSKSRRSSKRKSQEIVFQTFRRDLKRSLTCKTVTQGILALGGELHADANAALLARGSEQKHLWGIDLYPDKKLEDWIEYIALINIRPATGNRSMEIKDPHVRGKIRDIVHTLLPFSTSTTAFTITSKLS